MNRKRIVAHSHKNYWTSILPLYVISGGKIIPRCNKLEACMHADPIPRCSYSYCYWVLSDLHMVVAIGKLALSFAAHIPC